MPKDALRLTDKNLMPQKDSLKEFLGNDAFSYWSEIRKYIEEAYPKVFSSEWLFGGEKHGWSLRFKKNKSFCTMIPEKNRCSLVVVLGKKEREKFKENRETFSSQTILLYDASQTYHDGKWILFNINSDELFRDLKELLLLKRGVPKNSG